MADLSLLSLAQLAVGATLSLSGAYRCLSWWAFWRRSYTGKLITSGPYASVRHPFYSAFLLLVAGIAILMPIIETVTLAVLSIAVILYYVGREEEWLLKRYGKAYREYMKKVPWRLIPRVY